MPDLIRLLKNLTADSTRARGVRVRLGLLMAYLALPIDRIPDFIPVLGYADDAIVVVAVRRSVVREVGLEPLRGHWTGSPRNWLPITAPGCDDRIMRLVDLSHVIEHQMITYPGLPGPEIGEHLSFDASASHYAPGTEFAIGRVSMVANTGTYLDTPAHRFRNGHDLAGLPLEGCALLRAVVVDGGDGPIGPSMFSTVEVQGAAVLLRTGWDRYWGTDRYGDPVHPHLTEAGAGRLVDRGAALVGIDSVNIDDTTTGQRPAHTVLLAAGIPIIEHLTGLDGLPATGAIFTAVPPAIRGLATFPVRAFASVP